MISPREQRVIANDGLHALYSDRSKDANRKPAKADRAIRIDVDRYEGARRWVTRLLIHDLSKFGRTNSH